MSLSPRSLPTLAATLALSVASPALAADPALVGYAPRGLPDLFAVATAQSPEARTARINRDASRSGVRAAQLQRLPVPSATLEAGQGRAAANLTVFGPLYDFGQGIGGVRAARQRLGQAELRIAQAGYELSARLLELVQAWLVNSRRITAQRHALESLDELSTMADRRMEAGVASVSETALVRSRIAQLQSELAASEAQASTALDQIAQLAGVPVDLSQLDLAATDRAVVLADLVQHANDHALAVEIARQDAKVAEADATLARAQGLPVFGIAAERNDFSLVGGKVEYRIVGRITVAPGAGFSSFARARALQQSAAAAQMSVSAAQRNAAMAVTAEYNNLLATRGRMPQAQAALAATRDVLDSYRRLFVAGKRSWLDLLNSAREVAQAEIAVADLLTVAEISAVRVRLLSGERLWEQP